MLPAKSPAGSDEAIIALVSLFFLTAFGCRLVWAIVHKADRESVRRLFAGVVGSAVVGAVGLYFVVTNDGGWYESVATDWLITGGFVSAVGIATGYAVEARRWRNAERCGER